MEIGHSFTWDVFICHASEDKDFVEPLTAALRERGLRVWLDNDIITVGDSLRRSIDQGLARARYGIVVLSPAFFTKRWPQDELDGLDAKERHGRKVILPIWHKLDHEELATTSPLLAGKRGVKSKEGIPHVVEMLLRAMRKESSADRREALSLSASPTSHHGIVSTAHPPSTASFSQRMAYLLLLVLALLATVFAHARYKPNAQALPPINTPVAATRSLDRFVTAINQYRYSDATAEEPAAERSSLNGLHADRFKFLAAQGRLRCASSEYSSALEPLKGAMVLDPTNLEVLNTLGDVYFHLGDFDTAKSMYLKVVHDADSRTDVYWADLADAQLSLAAIFRRDNHTALAGEYLAKAAALVNTHRDSDWARVAAIRNNMATALMDEWASDSSAAAIAESKTSLTVAEVILLGVCDDLTTNGHDQSFEFARSRYGIGKLRLLEQRYDDADVVFTEVLRSIDSVTHVDGELKVALHLGRREALFGLHADEASRLAAKDAWTIAQKYLPRGNEIWLIAWAGNVKALADEKDPRAIGELAANESLFRQRFARDAAAVEELDKIVKLVRAIDTER